MKIKEIEKHKCDKCPLIELCGDAYEKPCLCTEERLEEIDIDVYKSCYYDEPFENIKAKALTLQIDIIAPKNIPEHEQEEWEEEHNCSNNLKYAFMELFLDKPITCSYDEWNK